MTIREALSSDSGDIARLTGELGYAYDAAATLDRLGRIVGRSDHGVWVAVIDGRIAGWLQAHASESLESGLRVEIVGLIVAAGCRRCGIGRALVQQAERWAAAVGSTVVVVRSNTKRLESHDFYPALGFSPTKTQSVYRKLLKEEPK